MRNTAHMKKFVEPETIEIGASKGPEQPELPEQVVEPVQCDQPETTACRRYSRRRSSRVTSHPDTSRPTRTRHNPTWMKDFVCN